MEEKKEWMEMVSEATTALKKDVERDGSMAPLWKPDGDLCEICSFEFTLINRRHHCRSCGSLVCNNCSTHRVILPEIDAVHPSRMCTLCYSSLKGHEVSEVTLTGCLEISQILVTTPPDTEDEASTISTPTDEKGVDYPCVMITFGETTITSRVCDDIRKLEWNEKWTITRKLEWNDKWTIPYLIQSSDSEVEGLSCYPMLKLTICRPSDTQSKLFLPDTI